MQRNSIKPPTDVHLRIFDLDGVEVWEVPASAPTLYLSHNYLRYIGKFTPQLPNQFIEAYTKVGDTVVDPMCGSGTTLIEAMRLDRKAIGTDINDVALMTSKVVTTFIEPKLLSKSIADFDSFAFTLKAKTLPKKLSIPMQEVLHYYDQASLSELLQIQAYIDGLEDEDVRHFFQLALLSILRQVSKANVKKMNTEIDHKKIVKPVVPTLQKQLIHMFNINGLCVELGLKEKSNTVRVAKGFADNTGLADNSADLFVLHPPYLSGTAFSETAQLQLAWLKINHKDLRKIELAMRGSYFHVPNGLQKYLIGWNHILKEAYRVLKPGGYCACVIGDGSINYTRIPLSPITVEFGKDSGFAIEKVAKNLLNHNTGRTLNKKMKFQEIIVLRKPNAN
jgi:DNA modification methylase